MNDSAYQAKLAAAAAIGREESRRQHLLDWTRAEVLVHIGATIEDVEDSTAVIAAAVAEWPALGGYDANSMDCLIELEDEPAWPWQRATPTPLRIARPMGHALPNEPWMAAVLAAANHVESENSNWLFSAQAAHRRDAIASAATFAEFEAAVAWANRCDSIERTWMGIACNVGFAAITAALDLLTRRGHITVAHVARAEALVRAKVGLSSRQLSVLPAFCDLLRIAFDAPNGVAGFQLALLSRVVTGMDAMAGEATSRPMLDRCLDVIDQAEALLPAVDPVRNSWRIWGQAAVLEDMTTQVSGSRPPPLPVVD